ncbi:unnamed protein product [Nezara viridula]|uniref:STING ligand-binding domain-containing protein n=1 Tax=Nezara viridula TaxID=85310 RepID=A0A9P0MVR3_NEZVI|nr:unnamed protein product [Nezara viridula]
MMDLTTYNGNEFFILLTVFAVISFLLFLICLILYWISHKNALLEVKRLSLIEGYANSMVQTYFYDNLKKIIPDQRPGTGLYDKIMMYKDTEKLEEEDFPLHKIFIIICASGFIPDALENIDKTRIKARKPLLLDHDGSIITLTNGLITTSTDGSITTSIDWSKLAQLIIDGRLNAISIYKVYHRNSKNHTTIATGPPLLTLLEASKEDPELKDNKKQIMEIFYKKLQKKLAENAEFTNSYELVFYNGMYVLLRIHNAATYKY